jgi:uncharacterized protein (TIGR00251 family)
MAGQPEIYPSNARLVIKVTPRAKKNQISGILEDGTIKVRVNAPPVGGKANKQLINYLADILNVQKSAVQIVSGLTNRKKIIHVEGIDQNSVQSILASHLE